MENHLKIEYSRTDNENSLSQSPFSSPTISTNVSQQFSSLEQQTGHLPSSYVQNYENFAYETEYKTNEAKTADFPYQPYYNYGNDRWLYDKIENDSQVHQSRSFNFASSGPDNFTENVIPNNLMNKFPISGNCLSSPSGSSSSASCASISPLSSSSSSNPSPKKKSSKKSNSTRNQSVQSNVKLSSLENLELSSPILQSSLCGIQVELSNTSLWRKFDSHTTEMIITKQGRKVSHLYRALIV